MQVPSNNRKLQLNSLEFGTKRETVNVRLFSFLSCFFLTTPLPTIGSRCLYRSIHRLHLPHCARVHLHRSVSFARVETPRPAITRMPTTLKEFETVFPKLVEDVKEHCKSYKLPDQALKWYEQVRTLQTSYCRFNSTID